MVTQLFVASILSICANLVASMSYQKAAQLLLLYAQYALEQECQLQDTAPEVKLLTAVGMMAVMAASFHFSLDNAGMIRRCPA